MSRKTARPKRPDDPRPLAPPFTDEELPFGSERLAEHYRKTRRDQGKSEVSELRWR